MAELIKLANRRVEQVSDATKFLLVCLTCHGKILMEAPKFPEEDFVLRAVANFTSVGHIDAFSQTHQIELINICERTSVQYPENYPNRSTKKSLKSIPLPPEDDY